MQVAAKAGSTVIYLIKSLHIQYITNIEKYTDNPLLHIYASTSVPSDQNLHCSFFGQK
jgi:hypothetical protein